MLAALLTRWAKERPDHPALITAERTLTYRELHALSDTLAAALVQIGVAPGDRVTLYAPNSWDWVVAYHGVLKAGAVANPINVMLTLEEVAYVINDCGAQVIFTSSDKAEALKAQRDQMPGLKEIITFGQAPAGLRSLADLVETPLPAPTVAPFAPGDLATIAYTSGTTGHPKGAMHSAQAIYLNWALTATMHGRTSRDVVVSALPAPHVYGNVVINSTFLAGGTVVLMERFDPDRALALIAQHGATMFEGVPTMYAMMLAHPNLATYDLTSLRCCTVGGQTIAASTMRAWEQASGAPLIELWGMTELAGLGTTHAIYAPNVHGSIGVPLPGIAATIAATDGSGRIGLIDEPGELCIRGPLVMLGYYNNPEATAHTIDAAGWLHTGDVATCDANGYYRVVDRLKDVIITGGYNIYPAEIERVLMGHPAVALVAVGRVPDELKGELARAYVVLRPGANATEAELIDYCRDHLAAYKLPRSVRFVSDVPKTSTGKIMRRELHRLDHAEGANQ
jgi:long-chain acyl-CoA synthetase